MNKPGFLIIGAMKAGTTTLYEDLKALPGLYLPPEKEPEDLIHPDVESADGKTRYFRKFAHADPGALCGEASTAYAKRPHHAEVPHRAFRILGPDLRIIYMTRHPISRIVSQYHHNFGLGLEKAALNDAVLENPDYVNFSRYEWQLEPWRASLGASNIMVVSFEDYLADRQTHLHRIAEHLAVPSTEIAISDTHRNRSAGKRFVPRGGVTEKVLHSSAYQYGLKPMLSGKLRDRVKSMILPKTAELNERLTTETEAELIKRLWDDPLARAYLQDETEMKQRGTE